VPPAKEIKAEIKPAEEKAPAKKTKPIKEFKVRPMTLAKSYMVSYRNGSSRSHAKSEVAVLLSPWGP
jgi:hypothetical protein